MAGLFKAIKDFVQSITIEPMIFSMIFGMGLVAGSGMNTELIMYKACMLEFNYTEEVCENLDDPDNHDIEEEVQVYINNFFMIQQWIASAPAIFYSLIAGALSDDFGRKPLLIFPLLGSFFASFVDILNYAFLESLPMEFLYLNTLYDFMGGMSVYYLGYYGFGSSITNPEERAVRLARFDGFERGGMIVGIALSPAAFKAIGYYGCYAVRTSCYAVAIIYLIFMVKEPIIRKKREESEGREKFSPAKLLRRYVWDPFKEMLGTLLLKREGRLQLLLYLQLCAYGTWLFALEVKALLYLFADTSYLDFDGEDWARYGVLDNIGGVVGLMVFMPVFSGWLKLHEGLVLTIVTVMVSLGFLLTAYTTSFSQFYVTMSLTFFDICLYSLGRSMLTKTVRPDEVGKVFSVVALLAAVLPVASNPAFRDVTCSVCS